MDSSWYILEERDLLALFGEDYRVYQREAGMLMIPNRIHSSVESTQDTVIPRFAHDHRIIRGLFLWWDRRSACLLMNDRHDACPTVTSTSGIEARRQSAIPTRPLLHPSRSSSGVSAIRFTHPILTGLTDQCKIRPHGVVRDKTGATF